VSPQEVVDDRSDLSHHCLAGGKIVLGAAGHDELEARLKLWI
jgi:hypothetical protein